MIIKSEKDIYKDEFRKIKSKYEQDTFLWGEELIDKTLVIYNGKIKELPEHTFYADKLIDCGLIIVNPRKKTPLKCNLVFTLPEDNRIFISEENFNAHWAELRRSINDGIGRAKILGTACGITRPEDLLDMEHLVQSTKTPKIEKNRIVYIGKARPEPEIRLMAARQSAIDNQKKIYFYSSLGGNVHDRNCEDLKNIKDAHFVGSATFPEGREYCPKCSRMIAIRKGCAPIGKEVPICNRFFTEHGVKTDFIWKLVDEKQIKFHAKTLDEMTVIGVEDTWKIIVTPENELQLWHNNYVKTSQTERYITDGFHNQGVEATTLTRMLKCITEYTWEKHLAGEARKNGVDLNTNLKEQSEQRNAQAEQQNQAEAKMQTGKNNRKNLGHFIFNHIKRINAYIQMHIRK